MSQHEDMDLLRRDGRPSGLTLDRYLLGELGDADRALVEERLSKSPEDAAVLAAMRDFDAANVLSPPAPRGRVLPFRRGVRAALPVAVVVAAAAGVALLAPGGDLSAPSEMVDSADVFRAKGAGFAMEVHAHDGVRTRRLGARGAVRAGERLGFRVEGGAGGHLLIAGIDARSQPYLCYPQDTGGASAPAPVEDAPVVLPAAVRLDDSPGTETLVAMLCPQPFSYEAVARSLRLAQGAGDAASPVRAGCVQRVVSLTKEPR